MSLFKINSEYNQNRYLFRIFNSILTFWKNVFKTQINLIQQILSASYDWFGKFFSYLIYRSKTRCITCDHFCCPFSEPKFLFQVTWKILYCRKLKIDSAKNDTELCTAPESRPIMFPGVDCPDE